MPRKRSKKMRDKMGLYQMIRRDWHGVNPVTRIESDKRKKPPKYKQKEESYGEYSELD